MTKRNRVNVAWVVLLTSFFLCVSLTVSFPFGYRYVVQNSRSPILMTLQGIQGTPIERERGEALDFQAEASEYAPPARMQTSRESETGLFQFYEPDSRALLARLQTLGNSDVRVDRAYVPRFQSSNLNPHLFVTLFRGRIRLSIPPPPSGSEPLIVFVETGDGSLIRLDTPGAYSLESRSSTTQLSVLEGHATLSAPNNVAVLDLVADQRGMVRAGVLEGPLSTDRNLITNGTFGDGFDSWTPLAWVVERDEQPSGETIIEEVSGEPTLRFRRIGEGNARNDMRQELNESVTAFSDMRLLVGLRIVEQSLSVCGGEGFECPLSVRIEYETEQGEQFAWEQGYYAKSADPGANAPQICARCGWPVSLNEHQLVPRLNEVAFFESPNLIATLGTEGIKPIFIQSITLTAEGHSFAVDVVEVSLIVREQAADAVSFLD